MKIKQASSRIIPRQFPAEPQKGPTESQKMRKSPTSKKPEQVPMSWQTLKAALFILSWLTSGASAQENKKFPVHCIFHAGSKTGNIKGLTEHLKQQTKSLSTDENKTYKVLTAAVPKPGDTQMCYPLKVAYPYKFKLNHEYKLCNVNLLFSEGEAGKILTKAGEIITSQEQYLAIFNHAVNELAAIGAQLNYANDLDKASYLQLWQSHQKHLEDLCNKMADNKQKLAQWKTINSLQIVKLINYTQKDPELAKALLDGNRLVFLFLSQAYYTPELQEICTTKKTLPPSETDKQQEAANKAIEEICESVKEPSNEPQSSNKFSPKVVEITKYDLDGNPQHPDR